METTQCKVCGETFEGFSHKDLKYRMIMHTRSKKCIAARKRKEEESIQKAKDETTNQ